MAPPPDDLRRRLRLERELRPADQPRRGGARQGIAGRRRCPATGGSSGPPLRALLALHVGLPRQAAALHGQRARRRAGVERGARAELGRCWHDPAHAGDRPAGRATSTRPTGRDPALWSQDTTPDGFRWIVGDDAGHNLFAFERIGSDGSRAGLRGSTSPPSRTSTTGSGCPGAAPGARSSTPTPTSYGGSGVGNLGSGAGRGRRRGTVGRPRPRCGSRRWARSGCVRRPDLPVRAVSSD